MALVALDDARAIVLAHCRALPAVEVPIDDALGLVTGAAIVAGTPVPPFTSTAMDGFAVRAGDTVGAPRTLDVVDFLPAGRSPAGMEVGPGQAIRIMTGAPIPVGADAVVMVERTAPGVDADHVEVLVEVPVGNHVRPAGEDLVAGDELLAAGAELSPGALGLLASLGLRTVSVHPRPRVGVLSTGDELVTDGSPLEPGQIYESNRAALLALCRQSGFTAVDLGTAVDTEDAITAAIVDGVSRCDAVLTSGGVSMGDVDLVKVVLDQLSGGTFRWMQVAQKPAKPFAFGTVDGTPVFGLPGNPASSMISFECFARPGIRALMGFGPAQLARPTVAAVVPDGLPRTVDGKLHLVRVTCRWDDAAGAYVAGPSGAQASNLLRSMALADAIALVDDGDGVPPGGRVRCWLLH